MNDIRLRCWSPLWLKGLEREREWFVPQVLCNDHTQTYFILVEIQKYLEYINSLKYEDEPNYEYIRKLFRDGLKKRGCTDDGKNVNFTKVSSATADLCNGYNSEEKETRDNAAKRTSPRKRKSEDTSVSPTAKKSKASPGKKVIASRGRAPAKQQAEAARPRAVRGSQRKPITVDSATSP